MNSIILMGRTTEDIEIKESERGTKYCNFTLAVDRNGVAKSVTDFFRCTAFEKNAEFLSKFIKKGKRILVRGSMHIDSYEKNGEKRVSPIVSIIEIEYADGKKVGEVE